MANDLKKYGPWALITGGSEGVGAAAARQLAADGFKLVLVARKPGPLEDLKAELEASGAEVRIKSVDLAADDALAQVRRRVLQRVEARVARHRCVVGTVFCHKLEQHDALARRHWPNRHEALRNL